jgi:hypothetical protein
LSNEDENGPVDSAQAGPAFTEILDLITRLLLSFVDIAGTG